MASQIRKRRELFFHIFAYFDYMLHSKFVLTRLNKEFHELVETEHPSINVIERGELRINKTELHKRIGRFFLYKDYLLNNYELTYHSSLKNFIETVGSLFKPPKSRQELFFKYIYLEIKRTMPLRFWTSYR